MTKIATHESPPMGPVADLLHSALIDSRQRWRDLVSLAADFAFETDAWGNFALVTPDPALGWAANILIGRSSTNLLADAALTAFNPFRVTARIRHRQAWLKRADGGASCLTFCAAPIVDAQGHVTGARGVGIDVTELDSQAAQIAAALRRAEVLDHILSQTGQEVLAQGMMEAALRALVNALGAEGAAVLLLPRDGSDGRLVHVSGTGVDLFVAAPDLVQALAGGRAVTATSVDGRPVLIAQMRTRTADKAALIACRAAMARPWDQDETHLLGSAANIVRMVLEHEAIQREMTLQARTDPLTGLLNRRAFLEEAERHLARLDRENKQATLIFADLDHFKPVNDRLGHEAGDRVLKGTSALLRRIFRTGDLVARLGGDEFAIWMTGADHMTAAERAEYLRDAVPAEMAEITGPDGPRLTLSIGIACREPGQAEPLDSLMRRADMAMYAVKNGGRGHWRVSLRGRI